MILKLDMKHQGTEVYKNYINHDTGMTLTYVTARSTQEQIVKMCFEGQNLQLIGKSTEFL